MTDTLTGATALVTGSTSGIGRAVADALASRGAHVIVSGRNAERGEAVVAQIRAAGGKADFVAAELSDRTSALDLAAQASAITGKIDVLVNNAGIFSFGPTAEVTAETFDEMYGVNVKAPFFLVAALAPSMASRGAGAIINISTALAVKGSAGSAVYASSKAAIDLLTKSWAAEFGPSGVRVNAVSPGPVYTEGAGALGDGAIDGFAVGTPAARVGRVTEIAEAVAFLAGDGASYVHGAILAVDGGASAV